jgi:hypothetical protein
MSHRFTGTATMNAITRLTPRLHQKSPDCHLRTRLGQLVTATDDDVWSGHDILFASPPYAA